MLWSTMVFLTTRLIWTCLLIWDFSSGNVLSYDVIINKISWDFLLFSPYKRKTQRFQDNVILHCNVLFSSAVEVPSYFIGWYFMDKWGRRWILFSTMMIGGLSCISCMFVPVDADPWWTVGLAMIGKFNIALSFAVIYVYAGELMPTVVRSQVGITMRWWPYFLSLLSAGDGDLLLRGWNRIACVSLH